ncbi:AzlD domain-containing protein [Alkalicoccobacillus porphyridii]|uniref:AzlD domain-containing protein n=1 Tax=Alkalicoccobacillus porphyridii TaxID=2597270 RepID=A0A553ZZF5_9BACI|nr:AzlD domain-containing protein [Alkalicoccobacillus porphyridii]TSB46828.1 AzlD domain-containing protein [Alkalicoccobacillus porphyridii]
MTDYFYVVIIGCALVTLLPRILPFIVVRKVNLPEPFLKWLSFIPVCILTALIVDELLITEEVGTIQLNMNAIIAAVPTLIVALRTKSLSLTVLTGVVAMALVRLFI